MSETGTSLFKRKQFLFVDDDAEFLAGIVTSSARCLAAGGNPSGAESRPGFCPAPEAEDGFDRRGHRDAGGRWRAIPAAAEPHASRPAGRPRSPRSPPRTGGRNALKSARCSSFSKKPTAPGGYESIFAAGRWRNANPTEGFRGMMRRVGFAGGAPDGMSRHEIFHPESSPTRRAGASTSKVAPSFTRRRFVARRGPSSLLALRGGN